MAFQYKEMSMFNHTIRQHEGRVNVKDFTKLYGDQMKELRNGDAWFAVFTMDDFESAEEVVNYILLRSFTSPIRIMAYLHFVGYPLSYDDVISLRDEVEEKHRIARQKENVEL